MSKSSDARLQARRQKMAKSRLQSQDNRDMVDAIREMLGLDPLFFDPKDRNQGYISGAIQTHEG